MLHFQNQSCPMSSLHSVDVTNSMQARSSILMRMGRLSNRYKCKLNEETYEHTDLQIVGSFDNCFLSQALVLLQHEFSLLACLSSTTNVRRTYDAKVRVAQPDDGRTSLALLGKKKARMTKMAFVATKQPSVHRLYTVSCVRCDRRSA